MKVYGIKSCGSVKKAIKFFNDHSIKYEFVDLKKTPVNEEKIKEWLNRVDIDTLLNKKGTKYRTLRLKELNLSDEDKLKWLSKENLLIKRPVIEYKNQIIVGFDENRYIKRYLNRKV